MSKKTFTLVSSLIGAVEAAAVAIITYIEPAYASAINGSIVVACTAAITICGKFVNE